MQRLVHDLERPILTCPTNHAMKPSFIAIPLIVIGGAMLAHEGSTNATREKTIDLGHIQVTAEKQHFVYLRL